MSLPCCRSKFLISSLLWWKEIEEKATTLKWGDLELKIDSMCPFARIAQQNFPSEGDFNGTGARYWPSVRSWVIFIAKSHEWQLFSEPVVMMCQVCLLQDPTCGCTLREKWACTQPCWCTRVRPARAVGMGTPWVCEGHQGWVEFIRQKLAQSRHEGLSSCLTASSCHSLITFC